MERRVGGVQIAKADRKGRVCARPASRAATRQAPRFSFCAKTLEQSRVFYLLLLAACAPPSVALPRFDRTAVQRDYPSLAGRIVAADELDSPQRPAAGGPRWDESPDRRILPPCTVRVALMDQPPVEIMTYDGRLDLPGVGVLEVAGRTIEEAERMAREALARWYTTPRAELAVLEPGREELRRVALDVVGYVRAPARVADIVEGVPMSIAIRKAGGLRDGAVVNQMLLIRGGTVAVCDWLANLSGHDVPVAEDDIVYVPGPFAADAPYDPAWAAIAAYFEGRLDRGGLLSALARP
jgi:hypothetical protein